MYNPTGAPVVFRIDTWDGRSITYTLPAGAAAVFTFRGATIMQVNTKARTAALERAGIENFRWHDLRHAFATWHRQAGVRTHELQRFGGWKTRAMVERYAHVAPEALQGAAARLDGIAGYGTATPQGPTA